MFRKVSGFFGSTRPSTSQPSTSQPSTIQSFLDSCLDVQVLCEKADIIYLWVIDMQHDFVDEVFADPTLFTEEEKSTPFDSQTKKGYIALTQDGVVRMIPAPYKKVEARSNWSDAENQTNEILAGRFAVDEGKNCIDDIQRYIDILTRSFNNKFEQAIFSRDIHTYDRTDPDHCSFQINSGSKGTIDGIGFPSHCVNGTNGCKLHPRIEEMCKNLGGKATVVMKGCSQDTDSYGAYPYSCEQGHAEKYTKLRQQNGCSRSCESPDNEGLTTLKNTGSVILTEPDKFNKYVELNTVDPRKRITTMIKDDPTKNILHLVCGLAGDYCVRDTAINLKFAFPNHTVAVLADAVRYPALPAGAIGIITPGTPNTLTPEQIEGELHLRSFIDGIDEKKIQGPPKYYLTPADTLLYTYSPMFFERGNGVLFTMDKTENGTTTALIDLQGSVIGQADGARPIRDKRNPYWCLARYFHLLGKQFNQPPEQSYTTVNGFDIAKISNKVSTQMQLLHGGSKRKHRKHNHKSHRKYKTRKSKKSHRKSRNTRK